MEPNYISKGDGIPFFFQHGLGGNLGQAQDLLKDLAGVQLISMDSRGHGKTLFNTEDKISFNKLADDLIALADTMKIQKAIFGGISMGASVTLNLALRYPEKVNALILVRPAWLNKPQPSNLHILQNLVTFINAKKGDQLIETKEYQQLAADHPLAAQSVFGQLKREQAEFTATVFQRLLDDCPFKKAEELHKLNVPALILASKNDVMHPFHFGTYLHEHIAGSKLVEVPSRYLNADLHQKEILFQVRNFLKSNSLI